MKSAGKPSGMFLKLFKLETKRYFTDISLLIIAFIVPVLLIITLLGSLLPLLFRGAELNNITIALYNEDLSYETEMIVRHLTESDSVEDFVDVVDVYSIEEGMDNLNSGEVSALIHIPENLQENLYKGYSQTLYFYSGETDKQIVNLLYEMLNDGLNNINKAQKSVDIIYYSMLDMGYERQAAAEEYTNTAMSLFADIISRSDVFKDYNEASATGDYLNIEYYLISTLLLSLFFLSLPICAKFSKDKLSGITDRGGFFQDCLGYSAAKIFSGSLFLLLPAISGTTLVLIVTGAFGLFSGSAALLICTVILSVLYFSIIMVLIGVYSKSTTVAVWMGFSVAIIISLMSGIFIPSNLMPGILPVISEITGLPSLIRLYGISLFGVKSIKVIINIIIMLFIEIMLFALVFYKVRKSLN